MLCHYQGLFDSISLVSSSSAVFTSAHLTQICLRYAKSIKINRKCLQRSDHQEASCIPWMLHNMMQHAQCELHMLNVSWQKLARMSSCIY